MTTITPYNNASTWSHETPPPPVTPLISPGDSPPWLADGAEVYVWCHTQGLRHKYLLVSLLIFTMAMVKILADWWWWRWLWWIIIGFICSLFWTGSPQSREWRCSTTTGSRLSSSSLGPFMNIDCYDYHDQQCASLISDNIVHCTTLISQSWNWIWSVNADAQRLSRVRVSVLHQDDGVDEHQLHRREERQCWHRPCPPADSHLKSTSISVTKSSPAVPVPVPDLQKFWYLMKYCSRVWSWNLGTRALAMDFLQTVTTTATSGDPLIWENPYLVTYYKHRRCS